MLRLRLRVQPVLSVDWLPGLPPEPALLRMRLPVQPVLLVEPVPGLRPEPLDTSVRQMGSDSQSSSFCPSYSFSRSED